MDEEENMFLCFTCFCTWVLADSLYVGNRIYRAYAHSTTPNKCTWEKAEKNHIWKTFIYLPITTTTKKSTFIFNHTLKWFDRCSLLTNNLLTTFFFIHCLSRSYLHRLYIHMLWLQLSTCTELAIMSWLFIEA